MMQGFKLYAVAAPANRDGFSVRPWWLLAGSAEEAEAAVVADMLVQYPAAGGYTGHAATALGVPRTALLAALFGGWLAEQGHRSLAELMQPGGFDLAGAFKPEMEAAAALVMQMMAGTPPTVEQSPVEWPEVIDESGDASM